MKTCTKCGEEFPATGEYFQVRKDSKDGFRGDCRGCRDKYNKSYRQENKEKAVAVGKLYYQKNRESIIKRQEKYNQENKETISEKCKTYHQQHRDAILERDKQYYQENKEYCNMSSKRYRQEHREDLCKKRKHRREESLEFFRERERQWQREHPEECRIMKQRRRAIKRQLPSTLTKEQWERIKVNFDNKCAYCGKELPLTQEHFVPLSKGGEYTHNNIIPACRTCNSSKNDSSFFDWYPRQKSYSKKRENALFTHLGYKDNVQQLALV